MKKRSFLAGMLTMALIVGLGMSALAATGSFTITVDPVNIQVNGTTFAPKDAKGNDVPVFAYGGTTYAPLRALAEAYGLTVGYDGASNMATVNAKAATPETPPATYSDWSKEDEAAYQEFKGLWRITFSESKDTRFINMYCYEEVAVGESVSEAIRIGAENVDAFLSSHTTEFIEKCCYFFDKELYNQYGISNIMYFYNGTLQGAWGWMDTVSADGWTCGYRKFID